MSNISNERLQGVINGDIFYTDEQRELASELLAYREAGKEQVVPDGWALVPKEPTENMVIAGFESDPNSFFGNPDERKAYKAMSGCRQAAYRARLCWAAMVAEASQPSDTDSTTAKAGEPKK